MRSLVGVFLIVALGLNAVQTATALSTESPSTTNLSANAASVVRGPNGVLLPVVGRFAGSTVVSSTCGREVVYEEGLPLEGVVDVVLDPGHGGPESGSVGANGLVERDLNLAVAFHTKSALEEMGHSVVLTRRSDLHMPIRQRTAIVRALEPDAFVSIHHNAPTAAKSNKPGTEVFAQTGDDESARLAGLLHQEVLPQTY